MVHICVEHVRNLWENWHSQRKCCETKEALTSIVLYTFQSFPNNICICKFGVIHLNQVAKTERKKNNTESEQEPQEEWEQRICVDE